MNILFSARVKSLRLEKNLKQEELAKALQTTQRRISCWEVGETEPSLADLWSISDFFGVTIDYLVGKEDY